MHNLQINLREPSAAITPADKLATDTATISELLALLGVKDPAALLSKYPDGALSAATLADLVASCGTRAGRVVYAALTVSKRLTQHCGIFLKPQDIWDTLRDIREHKKEHFVVFYLDTRNQEIKRDIVSIGTLNYNLVHPREVFEPAIRNLSAGIIVAHNHPSGCLEPSDEDLSLTKRLVQAGKLLGIEVLDHVIVTCDGYMSFKQKSLL